MRGRDRRRGHSLVEFAFLAPVMMLLIFGMMDLGRGFYFQTEVQDAARDTARVLIAPSGSSGPGTTAGCNQATRDLSNIGVSNVSCPGGTPGPPTTPNTAYVFMDCGSSADCVTAGVATTACGISGLTHSCITVRIYYLFSLLSPQVQSLGGPTLVVFDSAQMVSLW